MDGFIFLTVNCCRFEYFKYLFFVCFLFFFRINLYYIEKKQKALKKPAALFI